MMEKIIKIFVAYFGFLSLAFGFGLIGPTLPELQRLTGSNTQTISWVVTIRSLGQLVGSLLAGFTLRIHAASSAVCCDPTLPG